MGGADAQMAGFRIFQGDRAPLHGQGIGQDSQHGFHGLIEIQGLAHDLTNLVENFQFQFSEVSFHMPNLKQEICLRGLNRESGRR